MVFPPGKLHDKLSILLADAINVTLKEGEPVFVFTPNVLDDEINELDQEIKNQENMQNFETIRASKKVKYHEEDNQIIEELSKDWENTKKVDKIDVKGQ